MSCDRYFRPATKGVYGFFFSAQRFFIISESLFRPAAVKPPLFFLGAALVVVFADTMLAPRWAAQRRFIDSDRRLLPAGVRP